MTVEQRQALGPLTNTERQAIRAARSEAHKQRVKNTREVRLTRHALATVPITERRCDYCGKPLGSAYRGNETRKRFCSLTHKSNWWRREYRQRDKQAEKRQAA